MNIQMMLLITFMQDLWHGPDVMLLLLLAISTEKPIAVGSSIP